MVEIAKILAAAPRPPLPWDLPLGVLNRLLGRTVETLQVNHPGFFERLEGYWESVFLIDPADLPLVFVFHPNPDQPRLRAYLAADAPHWTARISGRLHELIDLFEGRVDGDALFFSRALMIEGDTGAVLALRNAIDAEEIALLAEATEHLGPLAGPLRRAGERATGLIRDGYDTARRLRDRGIEPVIAPLAESNRQLRGEVDDLKTQVAGLQATLRRRERAEK